MIYEHFKKAGSNMNKKIVYCLVVLSTQCFIQFGNTAGEPISQPPSAPGAEIKSAPGADLKKSSEIPEKRIFEVDPSVNPCDDFHAYVCGKAENSFQMREDRSSHTFAFSDSSERILEKKKSFFKNIDSEKKLKPRTEQMRAFYKACMNEEVAIVDEKRLVGELLKEVEQIQTMDQFIRTM